MLTSNFDGREYVSGLGTVGQFQDNFADPFVSVNGLICCYGAYIDSRRLSEMHINDDCASDLGVPAWKV